MITTERGLAQPRGPAVTAPSRCTKRCFRSRAKAARELRHCRNGRRRERRAYQCPLCSGWHLTSQKQRGGRSA